MIKKIIFLFIFVNFALLTAQNKKLYQGTINNTTKITLYLTGLEEGTYADALIGSYQYDHKKDYLLLNGFRNKSGHLSLVELSNANFTGTFLGTMTKNKITGKWISADLKKTYNFELVEITANKNQLKEFDDAILEKGNQFRNY